MTDIFSYLFSGLSGAFSFSGISIVRILLTIGLAFVIGVFILLVHQKTYRGVMYSRSTGRSFVLLAMITAAVLMPAISDVKVLVGLVGTLSFIRFRTSVKDPADIVYMIWAVTVGIMLGAKFFLPALVGSLVIGLLLLMYSSMKSHSNGPSMLLLRFETSATAEVNGLLRRFKDVKVTKKTASAQGVEMVVEISLRDSDMQIVDSFLEIPGMLDAALLGNPAESVD